MATWQGQQDSNIKRNFLKLKERNKKNSQSTNKNTGSFVGCNGTIWHNYQFFGEANDIYGEPFSAQPLCRL